MRAAVMLPALRTVPRKALAKLYREEFDSSAKLVVVCGFQLLVLVILWIGVILTLPLFRLESFKSRSITFCALAGLAISFSGRARGWRPF